MGVVLIGLIGFGAALVLLFVWNGAALLFGFPPPTPDQAQGMVMERDRCQQNAN